MRAPKKLPAGVAWQRERLRHGTTEEVPRHGGQGGLVDPPDTIRTSGCRSDKGEACSSSTRRSSSAGRCDSTGRTTASGCSPT